MARPGGELTNPVSGNRVVFRIVDEDRFEVDFYIKQTKPYVKPHMHAIQTESFEIIAGQGKWQLEGITYDLQPGDKVEVPPGVSHVNPWRAGDGVLHVRQCNTPGLDFDVYFETPFKAAQRGKANADGDIDQLHQAVILNQARSKSYLSGAPVWLQKATLPILAAIGRLRGDRFRYED